jgi:twitching motility protein PilT
MTLRDIILLLRRTNYSDLQFTVGKRVAYRLVDGFKEIKESPFLDSYSITPFIDEMLRASINGEKYREVLNNKHFVDFAISYEGERFRVSIYYEKGNLGASLRRLRNTQLFLDQLHIDPYLKRFISDRKGGLLLITGRIASGKTTTAVALLQEITRSRSGLNIVTIEDPIEYIIPQGNCFVSQKEVGEGLDVFSYEDALKSTVRGNPDIIFLGEIREQVAAKYAVLFSSMGHFVVATFHAYPAIVALERFTSLLNKSDRLQFAGSLRAVVAQELHLYNGIYFPTFGIIENTSAISKIIEEERFSEINAYKGNGLVKTEEESYKEQIALLNRNMYISNRTSNIQSHRFSSNRVISKHNNTNSKLTSTEKDLGIERERKLL